MNLTNANKGAVILAVNAVLYMLVGFGVPLSSEQVGLVGGAVNALMGAYLALTYQDSPKRLPEGMTKDEVAAVITEEGGLVVNE